MLFTVRHCVHNSEALSNSGSPVFFHNPSLFRSITLCKLQLNILLYFLIIMLFFLTVYTSMTLLSNRETFNVSTVYINGSYALLYSHYPVLLTLIWCLHVSWSMSVYDAVSFKAHVKKRPACVHGMKAKKLSSTQKDFLLWKCWPFSTLSVKWNMATRTWKLGVGVWK